jgi:uncharacterized membrane protein YccC
LTKVRSSWRSGWLDLSGVLRLGPAEATVVPAVLAVVCTAVPLLALLAVDRLDLAAFAAFGTFTGLFGRNEPYRQRGQTLAVAAVTLVAAVALAAVVGVLARSGVVHVLLIAVVAGLAKLVLDALRASPPGALMPTFAAAVTVTTVTEPAVVPVAVGVCATTAAWSWLVCMSPRLLDPQGPQRVASAAALRAVARRVETAAGPSHDRARHAAALALERAWHAVAAFPGGRGVEKFEALLVHAETVMRQARLAVAAEAAPPAEAAAECRHLAARLRRGPLPQIPVDPDERAELAGIHAEAELAAGSSTGPAADPLMRTRRASRWAGLAALRPRSPGVALAARTALAAAVSGLAAAAVGLGYSYWASVSAVAVLAAMNLSGTTHRAVQRGIGSAVGVLIGVTVLLLGPGPAVALLLVIVCTGLAELTVTRNYALGVLFATPVALLLAALAQPLPPLELARDRLLDTVVGAVVAVGVALLLPNRGLARALNDALADAEDALDAASRTPPVGRSAAAKTLAARLTALRTSYDAAAGEAWTDDLPAEKVLAVERDCHIALARLTA